MEFFFKKIRILFKEYYNIIYCMRDSILYTYVYTERSETNFRINIQWTNFNKAHFVLCFMSKFCIGSSLDLCFIYISLIIHYSYGCLYYNPHIYFFKPRSIVFFPT